MYAQTPTESNMTITLTNLINLLTIQVIIKLVGLQVGMHQAITQTKTISLAKVSITPTVSFL